MIVGNSQSGTDISMELAEVAKEIHLSAKSLTNISEGLSKVISKYENLHLRPQVPLTVSLTRNVKVKLSFYPSESFHFNLFRIDFNLGRI